MRNGMKVLISLLFVAIAGLLITTTVINMRQVSTPASKGDVVMFEKPRGVVPGKVFKIIKYETLPLCSVRNPRAEIVDSQ